MEDAPLPPHERTWRHPSELGPTPGLVEPSSIRSRALAFSSGAIAAVLVAVMVVSVTPRRTNSPSAVSATTIPAASVQLRSVGQPVTTIDSVRVEQRGLSNGPTVALAGAPNAISSAPTASPTGLAVASQIPHDDSRVIILTDSFTYDVAWGELERLVVPDGAIVITHEGELIATFVDDDLRLLVD
ncbi:hypothetical protein [Ilumatobacter coccineus]|uniref:Uncharacterized protein n=1 Tax=Ilumatobacter coccineus (strain NBRC 103263 / KCTC 29153 / YM16-304) TaxID=1313172 RepID=A0A6C7E7T0_ILUCY|nr:hypothetical protein [Ilumatobacter coccineus]BAN01215.1 hypothetical protein YM304_09010 [Ilumatobacter coccineus YM16-304]